MKNIEIQMQFSHIANLIATAKQKSFQAVNRELVTLYWQVGEYVSKQVESKAWGKSVVKELANFIQQFEPNVVGFSSQNIWRMKQFYEAFKDFPKLSTLWRELSWSHNRAILPLKSVEEKDDIVVEYALNRNISPTLVADYKTKLPSKALLQQKWREVLESIKAREYDNK